MFAATCSSCGNEAQVPFRPTSGKPVYCTDCFRSHAGLDLILSARVDRGPAEPESHPRPGQSADPGRSIPRSRDITASELILLLPRPPNLLRDGRARSRRPAPCSQAPHSLSSIHRGCGAVRVIMDWQNAIFGPGWVWSMLSMVLVVGSLLGLYRQPAAPSMTPRPPRN